LKKALFYVSGHGFGHAVRSALLVKEFYKAGIRTEIISSAERFIFDVNLKGTDYGYRRAVSDIGVVQNDAITVDIPSTLKEWTDLLKTEGVWFQHELGVCRSLKPDIIISDTVPFPLKLAKEAGIPSMLLATFTWDWILRYYSDDDERFSAIADRLEEHYSHASMLFTTPLSFGLPEIGDWIKVPLIGKRSGHSKESLREKLGLDDRPAYLVSFGGMGISNIENFGLRELTEFQFLVFSENPTGRSGNLIRVRNGDFDHADIVKASDGVISKPGYGVSAECILNHTPLIYTEREKFAEYEPMVRELKNYLPMAHIPNSELYSGGLGPVLNREFKFTDSHISDSGLGSSAIAEKIISAI
jgi:UDP:flavonoid glycosyltransferase YjiC (YdhE family)